MLKNLSCCRGSRQVRTARTPAAANPSLLPKKGGGITAAKPPPQKQQQTPGAKESIAAAGTKAELTTAVSAGATAETEKDSLHPTSKGGARPGATTGDGAARAAAAAAAAALSGSADVVSEEKKESATAAADSSAHTQQLPAAEIAAFRTNAHSTVAAGCISSRASTTLVAATAAEPTAAARAPSGTRKEGQVNTAAAAAAADDGKSAVASSSTNALAEPNSSNFRTPVAGASVQESALPSSSNSTEGAPELNTNVEASYNAAEAGAAGEATTEQAAGGVAEHAAGATAPAEGVIKTQQHLYSAAAGKDGGTLLQSSLSAALRQHPSFSLEEALNRKWKQLQHYSEEEQLFKAYQYLLLLEQQVEHRLAVVTSELHRSSSTADNCCCDAVRPSPLPDGKASSLQLADAKSQHQLEHQQDPAAGGSAGASRLKNAEKIEDAKKTMAEIGKVSEAEKLQRRLQEQEELLLKFQKRLLTEQTLKNLRVEMAIFHRMLVEFHLEHLLQICDEPRLSCCESLVSTADESEQQQQHQLGGGLDSSSSSSSNSRASVAGAGAAASSVRASGRAVSLENTAGSAAALLSPHQQQQRRGSCVESAAAAQTTDREETDKRGEDGNAGADVAAGAGSRAAGKRQREGEQDEHHHAGSITAAPFERKPSASKMFKQGLRSVVGRKMSFGRRSGVSRRSSVRKIVSAKKKQDDAGWMREKGRCLDLAYRVERDNSVSIKVRGKLPCKLFEVLAILNETDLAATWAPFFKSAELEYHYSKAAQLVRQVYDYPLLGCKETITFCAGVNALEEAGCVFIFCCSPPEHDGEFLGKPVPPPGSPTGLYVHLSCKGVSGVAGESGGKVVGGESGGKGSESGGGVLASVGGGRGSKLGGGGSKLSRIQAADLVFLLYPISSGNQTTLELYGNFQHGLRFVPMKIITYIVKKVVKSMFVAIAKQSQQFHSGPYKERVDRDPQFYGWMRENIETYVQQQQQQHLAALKLRAGTDSASLASFNFEEFQD